ncbi:hypothetical protein [Leucobacter salsicius]|nr:hypothetical protein [Leucobacter salsicius]
MQPNEALEVLKSDDALQQKLSRGQFYSLLTAAVIVPAVVLMIVGAWF